MNMFLVDEQVSFLIPLMQNAYQHNFTVQLQKEFIPLDEVSFQIVQNKINVDELDPINQDQNVKYTYQLQFVYQLELYQYFIYEILQYFDDLL
jgi:hypothetical protein